MPSRQSIIRSIKPAAELSEDQEDWQKLLSSCLGRCKGGTAEVKRWGWTQSRRELCSPESHSQMAKDCHTMGHKTARHRWQSDTCKAASDQQTVHGLNTTMKYPVSAVTRETETRTRQPPQPEKSDYVTLVRAILYKLWRVGAPKHPRAAGGWEYFKMPTRTEDAQLCDSVVSRQGLYVPLEIHKGTQGMLKNVHCRILSNSPQWEHSIRHRPQQCFTSNGNSNVHTARLFSQYSKAVGLQSNSAHLNSKLYRLIIK